MKHILREIKRLTARLVTRLTRPQPATTIPTPKESSALWTSPTARPSSTPTLSLTVFYPPATLTSSTSYPITVSPELGLTGSGSAIQAPTCISTTYTSQSAWDRTDNPPSLTMT